MNTVDERRDEQLAAIRRSTIQLASGVMAINGGGMLSLGGMMPLGAPMSNIPSNKAVSKVKPPADVSSSAARRLSRFDVLQKSDKIVNKSASMQNCFCCELVCGDGEREVRPRYRVTRRPADKVEHLLELSIRSELSGLCCNSQIRGIPSSQNHPQQQQQDQQNRMLLRRQKFCRSVSIGERTRFSI